METFILILKVFIGNLAGSFAGFAMCAYFYGRYNKKQKQLERDNQASHVISFLTNQEVTNEQSKTDTRGAD